MRYYGFIQMQHGADHLYIFSEEQIKEEIKRGYLKEEDLPTEEQIAKNKEECKINKISDWDAWELDFYPVGGSNSGPSYITVLESKEDALAYLMQDGAGPDQEDPELVSLAEYYFRIEKDEGCARELLKEAGLNEEYVETLEEEAIKEWTDIENEICDVLDIKVGNFYDDEYRNIRLSDVDMIGRFKKLISYSDMTFSKPASTSEPEIQIQLPEEMAKDILRIDGDYRKDELDKVYLVIEKEPDGEIIWNVTDYTNGSTFDKFTYENNDFVTEHIEKIIMSALEEKEQLKTDKEPDIDR